MEAVLERVVLKAAQVRAFCRERLLNGLRANKLATRLHHVVGKASDRRSEDLLLQNSPGGASPPRPRPEQLQRLLSLEAGSAAGAALGRRQSCRTAAPRLKVPLRAARLLLLAVVLPALLVAAPLYMRYRVYADQLYPAAASDMRLLDARVSTTWCQRQLVRVNTTFNAFLMPEMPQIKPQPLHLSMVRELVLEDDMKEYWAFYLLKGSSITVSTCVRWPGASLIVIRGHKHLHECAYIGDDSSEEEEEQILREAMEAAQEKAALGPGVWPIQPATPSSIPQSEGDDRDGDPNSPSTMRRIRPGVIFHRTHAPIESHEVLDHSDDPEHHYEHEEDLHKVAHNLLHAGVRVLGPTKSKVRTTTSKPKLSSEEPTVKSTLNINETHKMRHHRIKVLLDDINKNSQSVTETIHITKGSHTSTTGHILRNENSSDTQFLVTSTPHSLKNSSEIHATSGEVFEEVLHKIKQLGPRGQKVLKRLNQQLGGDENEEKLRIVLKQLLENYDRQHATESAVHKEANQNMEDKHSPRHKTNLREIIDKATHQNTSTTIEQVSDTYVADEKSKRWRRHIKLASQLIDDDEEADAGIEEFDLEADGFADHHAVINETDPLDMSNSEFWSSFSSSEEALLNCAGLVLNLPLTPSRYCTPHGSEQELHDASLQNTLTYIIPTSGYYFFVFNSENEVQKNYLRAHFQLEKRVYNVSNPLDACVNSTEPCYLPLDFWTNEKVVLELPAPLKPNDTDWNQEYVIQSTCEPRTALYLGCVIAVPMVILIFAFQ